MPPSKAVARQRARVANAVRFKPGSPEYDAACRDLRAAKLREHIQQVVSGWPPLSDGQRTSLAELLVPARDAIRAHRLGALEAIEAEIP